MKEKSFNLFFFLFLAAGLVRPPSLPAAQSESKKGFEKPAFWGTRLINLPTAQIIEKGEFQFRVSHRFVPEVTSGRDFFFGLDGPANVLLGLGYGLGDHLAVTLGRTNFFQEAELGLDWLIAEQSKGRFSFSSALHIGGSLVTRSEEGVGLFAAQHMKFNVQLSLSRQFSDRLSLLLVPSYSSNTNHWESPSQGTLAVGLGGRWMVGNDLSVIAEWVPVLGGFRADFSGLGIGLEKKIGGHVFHVFFLSSSGLTSDQFLPGGDLNLLRGGFHFGFNIFRTF